MPPSHAKIRLKSATQKLKFTLNCSHKCPCTFVTPPRFREKRFYVKLKHFLQPRKPKMRKPIADPKRKSKINMRSRWTFFQILLMSAAICI